MVLGGNENFKINVINNLKNTFMFSSEETKAFTYLDIQLSQNDNFNLTINHNNYIYCISEIKLSHERLKENNSPLSNEEEKVQQKCCRKIKLGCCDIKTRYKIFSLWSKHKSQTTKFRRRTTCQQNNKKHKELQLKWN